MSSSRTTYETADEVRAAYLEGDLDEEELEDCLDDEELLEADRAREEDETESPVVSSDDYFRAVYASMGVAMFTTLWMVVGFVVGDLGGVGDLTSETAASVSTILLGSVPLYYVFLHRIWDQMLLRKIGAVSRAGEAIRAVVSAGWAAMVFFDGGPPVEDVSGELASFPSDVRMIAAVLVALPALAILTERLVERYGEQVRNYRERVRLRTRGKALDLLRSSSRPTRPGGEFSCERCRTTASRPAHTCDGVELCGYCYGVEMEYFSEDGESA